MKNAFGIAPKPRPSAFAMMLDAARGLDDNALLGCIRVMLDQVGTEALVKFANETWCTAHDRVRAENTGARHSLTKRAAEGGGVAPCAVAREGEE